MKTLKLNATGVSLYDDSLPHDKKDDLIIKIEGVPTYNALFYFVGYANAKEIKRQRITPLNCTVIIAGEDLTAGKFGCRIEQWTPDKTRQQKIFSCEEIGICDGAEYTEDPSIAAIRHSLEELEAGYKAADEANKISLQEDIDARLAEITKRLNRLTEFAKACIEAIPYISDLKIEGDN